MRPKCIASRRGACTVFHGRTRPMPAALMVAALVVPVLYTACATVALRELDREQRRASRALPGDSKVLQGAKRQLARPAAYTPGYFRIGYPNGDIPATKGVCTDVVIRALRYAGKDLQRLIREDMRKRFATYPRRERRPDPNIDHRRVPNQMHFLRRYGRTLPNEVTGRTLRHWQPGDIVYWKLDNGLDHTGIVSDRVNGQGEPLVIHNIWQTAEEDVLTQWRIVGHFRYP